jgi:hypothetical protein
VEPERGDDRIIVSLAEAGIDFIIVGGTAAVLQGAPIVTEDLDILHRRTPENVDRLHAWLLLHRAYHRFDLANRRLPPTREALLGTGHINLATDFGKLDVLCELSAGEGYDEMLADSLTLRTPGIRVLGLERLIQVKSRAGRPKDRAMLPVLIATLDEQRRGKTT